MVVVRCEGSFFFLVFARSWKWALLPVPLSHDPPGGAGIQTAQKLSAHA